MWAVVAAAWVQVARFGTKGLLSSRTALLRITARWVAEDTRLLSLEEQEEEEEADCLEMVVTDSII